MKKLLLPLIAVLLLATGCRKEEIIVQEFNGSKLSTVYYDVAYGQWQRDMLPEYLYFDASVPELDESSLVDGFTLVYYVDQNNYDNPLPKIYSFNDVYGNPHEFVVRYDISEGKVGFILESRDGDYGALLAAIPDKMAFKVCVMHQ